MIVTARSGMMCVRSCGLRYSALRLESNYSTSILKKGRSPRVQRPGYLIGRWTILLMFLLSADNQRKYLVKSFFFSFFFPCPWVSNKPFAKQRDKLDSYTWYLSKAPTEPLILPSLLALPVWYASKCYFKMFLVVSQVCNSYTNLIRQSRPINLT